MTEKEFRIILSEVDELFNVKKIGSTETSWMAVGNIYHGKTIQELKERVDNLPANVELTDKNGQLWLTAKEKDEPLLVIPTTNLILFLITILTTMLAGSVMEGGQPFTHLSDIGKGFPFSFTLMLILGFHEFGHYYYARKHKVDVTLPYFIPAPTFIGTLGAFIKIKSPIQNRKALLDIGAAGPIVGFIVAIPVLFIGLNMSQVVQIEPGQGIILGDSILMKVATSLIFPGLAENEDIMLSSVAFAGWIGLLVTMLNLLPIGQLDGGHIAYAMLGEKQQHLAKFAFLALLPLSLLSLNWLFWAFLILLLMRTVKHPPILDIDSPLTRREKVIALSCLVIFIICFIPVPFGG